MVKQVNVSWRTRRRLLIGSLVFCAAIILHNQFSETVSELKRVNGEFAWMMAAALVLSYLGIRSWQDVAMGKGKYVLADQELESGAGLGYGAVPSGGSGMGMVDDPDAQESAGRKSNVRKSTKTD